MLCAGLRPPRLLRSDGPMTYPQAQWVQEETGHLPNTQSGLAKLGMSNRLITLSPWQPWLLEHNTVIVPVPEEPQKMAVVWTMVGTVMGDGLQTQSQPDAGSRDRGFQREVKYKDPLIHSCTANPVLCRTEI